MFNKSNSASASLNKDTLPENKQQGTPSGVASHTSSNTLPPNTSGTSIGRHTEVQGDIFSDENLTIDGKVEGTVTCRQNTVTLGQEGSLDGNVYAHTLHVSGRVEGNLVALEKVTIHAGANVSGTIITPNLIVEDGSKFRGSIDMEADNDVFDRIFDNGSQKAFTSESASTSNAPLPPKAKQTRTTAANPEHPPADDKKDGKTTD